MVVIANILYFAFSIVAAIKARKGQFYYFLFFGKISYQAVFKVKEDVPGGPIVNKPPME